MLDFRQALQATTLVLEVRTLDAASRSCVIMPRAKYETTMAALSQQPRPPRQYQDVDHADQDTELPA